MDKKIRWGVLGYARIAKNSVIPAIIKARNSELYAIATESPEKQKVCRKDFEFEKLYSDYDELLNDPNVDVVYIPLPNSLHCEWTIKAAEKGKHVLCEKPIALNSQEAIKMNEAAKRNNVKLMEAFMYSYTNRTAKVLEIVNSGILGELKFATSTFRFFLDRPNTIKVKPELGGGSLYDVGSYPVNFIGKISGKEPISVSPEFDMHDGVDINFSAVLKYEDGLIANINSGFNAFPRNYSEIVGTKGMLEIPDTFMGTDGLIYLTTSEGRKEIYIEKSERYVLEVEDFADAILNNREPLIPMSETMRNMRVIDRLLQKLTVNQHRPNP